MDLILAVLENSAKDRSAEADKASLEADHRPWSLASPSFATIILAGIVLALIAHAANALLIYTEFRERERMHAEANASHEAVRGLQGVLSLVQGVGSGQRGYVISGDRDHLEAYRAAARELPERLAALREHVVEDAAQLALLSSLEQLVADRLANSQRIVDTRRRQGAVAVGNLIETGQDTTRMSEISRVVSRMSQNETDHVKATLAESLEGSKRRFAYLAALLGAIAAIVAVVSVHIARTWRRCTDAEAALRVALARLRATFDGTMEGLLTVTRSGTIESINAAARRLLKLSPDKVQHPHVRRFIAHGPGSKGPSRVSLRTLVGKVGEVSEVWLRRTDRSVFPADLAINEIDLDGRRVFVVAMRDVSERHHIDRMKGEFVATVSHELRTPLSSISGSLGLIAGGAAGPLPDKAARLVAIAHSNTERLVRLVNDILDTEKIESGHIDIEERQVALGCLVSDVIETNRGLAETSGVSIEMPAPEDDLVVLGDVDHLTRVVTNLLSNAIKFSPAGGTVAVSLEGGPDAVILRVRDQGAGIPEAFQPRLFQRFSQADSSDTRAKGGSGLGLSIVKGIVERHGGSVSVDCPEAGGTVFEVRLPRHGARGATAGAPSPEHPMNILLCEDDDQTAQVFRTALEGAGFTVSVAPTGTAALAQLRRRHFDAALVDLGLPDRHGFEVVHELRNDPMTDDLPVLVITAQQAGPKVAGEAAALDIVDWIQKPAPGEEVVARLQRAMLGMADTLPVALHVDDDADTRSLVAEALVNTARLVQAATVEEGRRILARERIDAIILDLDLKGGAGIDLLPYAVNQEGQSIPVVAFSAGDAGVDVVNSVAAALTKSRVGLDVLADRVHALIRRQRAAEKRLADREQANREQA